MTRRPIVIDIAVLEKLVVTLNSGKRTFQDLYDNKQADGYHRTGEWGIWLSSQHVSGFLELFPFLHDAKTDFLNDLGIPNGSSCEREDIESEINIAKVTTIPSGSPT